MPGPKTRAPGELEADILRVLRDAPEPLGARQIQEALTGAEPAYTTVLTSLDRLLGKGKVERRESSPRRVRFSALRSTAEDASDSMMSALSAVEDHRAALLKFAGNLDSDDAAVLRSALESGRRSPS